MIKEQYGKLFMEMMLKSEKVNNLFLFMSNDALKNLRL